MFKTRQVPPARCDLDLVYAEAKRRYPELDLRLVDGPTVPLDGIAWLGQTWHQTDDDIPRETLLVQFATEQCVRAIREPRPTFDLRMSDGRWIGGDWMNFIPVVGNASKVARLNFDHLLNPNLGVSPGRACGVAERAAADEDGSRPLVDTAGNDRVVIGAPGSFVPADPAWGGGGPATGIDVRHFAPVIRTRNMRGLTVRREVYAPDAPLPGPPVSKPADEICVVLNGTVTYAMAMSAECGRSQVVDTYKGHVHLWLSRVLHVGAGSRKEAGTSLCFELLPNSPRSLHERRLSAGSVPRLRAPLPHAWVAHKTLNSGDAMLAVREAWRESALVSHDTRPKPGVVLHAVIHRFRLGTLARLGYNMLAAAVYSFGPGASASPVHLTSRLSKRFVVSNGTDLILAPIHGRLLLTDSLAGQSVLEPQGFAVIPAGATRRMLFSTDSGSRADVLIVTVGAAASREEVAKEAEPSASQ